MCAVIQWVCTAKILSSVTLRCFIVVCLHCDPMMSIVCPSSVNNFLEITSPKPSGGLSQEVSMILGWSPFWVVHNSGCHGNQKETLSKYSCKKTTGPIWKINWYKLSLGDPLPKLLKLFWLVEIHGLQGAWPVFPMYIKGKYQKSCYSIIGCD